MKGRKPYPFQVLEATNGKNRLTKANLDGRSKNEPKAKSNSLKNIYSQ